MNPEIKSLLRSDTEVKEFENYLELPIPDPSEGLIANAVYYNNAEWAEEYLIYLHRNEIFRSRWQAAIGDWTDKVVVDIGCGPGNLFATLQGKPKMIIGIDIASTSLEIAGKLGYTPVLADAHNLPFRSEFADIVMLNATLHHCEDMETVLKEAGRIVKPGGRIIIDHDPQLSAWNFKGIARLLWDGRVLLYRLLGKGFHKSHVQSYWGLKSEIHHRPGHGVSRQLLESTLKPLGFDLNIYPHNQTLGSEVLEGKKSKAAFKYRLGIMLSGRNPNLDDNALSLMCVAIRK